MEATQHAYERAKERMSWKPKVLDKMMGKAFKEGITHKETKGSLRRYIDKLWLQYKYCNNIRIYGEDIYLFSGERLITLYRLDSKLIKHLNYIK